MPVALKATTAKRDNIEFHYAIKSWPLSSAHTHT